MIVLVSRFCFLPTRHALGVTCKEEFQYRNRLHQIVCRQVCLAFPWLMTGIRGLISWRQCHSWADGPGCYTEAGWANHRNKPGICTLQWLRLLIPWLPHWWIINCELKQTLSLLPKLLSSWCLPQQKQWSSVFLLPLDLSVQYHFWASPLLPNIIFMYSRFISFLTIATL